MNTSFLSVLAAVFISLLSSSIIPKVHGGHPVRRSANVYRPGSEFIMDNSLLFVNGYTYVYLPNAQVAFMITRHVIDAKRGTSQYILKDGANGQTLLVLDSYDDTCNSKSHYNDQHGLAHFTIDPRGIKADRWYFNTPALLGSKFVFNRDFLGKGGQIKDEKSGQIVATLSVEKRKEPWLLTMFHSEMAFVLRTDGKVPAYILAQLLALVEMRVDQCGL